MLDELLRHILRIYGLLLVYYFVIMLYQSDCGRNHLIVEELGSKIEESNSSKSFREGLGQHTPDKTEGLQWRPRSAPTSSPPPLRQHCATLVYPRHLCKLADLSSFNVHLQSLMILTTLKYF